MTDKETAFLTALVDEGSFSFTREDRSMLRTARVLERRGLARIQEGAVSTRSGYLTCYWVEPTSKGFAAIERIESLLAGIDMLEAETDALAAQPAPVEHA